MNSVENHQIVVIGAGPLAVAAALLKRRGHEVLMLERQRFPRFPSVKACWRTAWNSSRKPAMDAVRSAGFQLKNGAAFACGNAYTYFDFREKFSPGPGTTYQVQRAQFDKILADEAERQGVQVRYEQEVTAVDFNGPALRWTYARRTVPATRYSATSCSTPAATAGYWPVFAAWNGHPACHRAKPSSPTSRIASTIPAMTATRSLSASIPLSAASGTG